MNECSEISDLPASTPTMKSTSHFGENDGDDPGFSKDDACRRAAMESGTTPHVAGDSRRARPAAPTAPAQSGGRTPPRVVQVSSNLSDRMFLGTLTDRWRCRCRWRGRRLHRTILDWFEPLSGADWMTTNGGNETHEMLGGSLEASPVRFHYDRTAVGAVEAAHVRTALVRRIR